VFALWRSATGVPDFPPMIEFRTLPTTISPISNRSARPIPLSPRFLAVGEAFGVTVPLPLRGSPVPASTGAPHGPQNLSVAAIGLPHFVQNIRPR
jgi:hypothetical protein